MTKETCTYTNGELYEMLCKQQEEIDELKNRVDKLTTEIHNIKYKGDSE